MTNVGVSHMDNDVFDEGPTLHIRTYETTADFPRIETDARATLQAVKDQADEINDELRKRNEAAKGILAGFDLAALRHRKRRGQAAPRIRKRRREH